MHKLRGLAAEQLKGFLIPREQGCQHIQPLFLRQAVQTRIHDRGAGLLIRGGKLLLVPQPVKELVRVQIQLGGDLCGNSELFCGKREKLWK